MDYDDPLLGLCMDYPRVICYSQKGVAVWNAGRLDTHFAKIDCPEIIKLQRVDATTYERVSHLAPRIMVVAKVRVNVRLNVQMTTKKKIQKKFLQLNILFCETCFSRMVK